MSVCASGDGVSGSQGFGGWELLFQTGEGPSFPGEALSSAVSSGLEPVSAMGSRSCLLLARRGQWPARLAESQRLFPALP